MKTVKITLLQGENELIFSTPIETKKINEIAGTLAYRITALMQKSRKYKMNIGLSFARKFDVAIEIDGKKADGTHTLLNGMVRFGITLQNNEASVDRFHGFISELVADIMTGQSQLEGTIEELKSNLCLN